MTGHEPGSATTAPPGTGVQEAWLGYTLAELTQVARRAAVYCRWGDRFPLPERFEIAWTGVVDHLAICDSPPEPFEVYKAGMRAIGRAGERELREHGVTRTSEGLRAMPRFEAYWTPRATPGADVRVVERVALWQVWAMLRPLHQLALLTMVAHGDYAAAAQAAGYPYTSFTCLVSEARTAFFALWHEGEARRGSGRPTGEATATSRTGSATSWPPAAETGTTSGGTTARTQARPPSCRAAEGTCDDRQGERGLGPAVTRWWCSPCPGRSRRCLSGCGPRTAARPGAE